MSMDADSAWGLHESGAVLPVYRVNGVDHVMLLLSAAVFTKDGSWWGAELVLSGVGYSYTMAQSLPVYDIPGGKTRQFDDKPGYLKVYFPREGPGKDPSKVTKQDYPGLEAGDEAGIREFYEETHKCGNHPFSKDGRQGMKIRETWCIPGGYTSRQGHQSQTVVTLLQSTEADRRGLLQCRLAFLTENALAFQAYHKWAKQHPDAPESEHWEHRPEFSDMRFVTLASFWKALECAHKQLEQYESDKIMHPKGTISVMRDELDRPLFGVIRSWPVYVLYRSGVWQLIQNYLNNGSAQ